MRTTILLIAMLGIATLPGCATRDAATGQYGPDPRIETAHQAVKAVSDATAPFNPYAALTSPAVEGIFGLVTAASLLFAKRKNTAANKSASVANTIAAGAAKQGPAVTAGIMDHASGEETHFAEVAAVLNANTPPGTAP